MMTLGLDNSEEALLKASKYLALSENRSEISDDTLVSLYRISSVRSLIAAILIILYLSFVPRCVRGISCNNLNFSIFANLF